MAALFRFTVLFAWSSGSLMAAPTDDDVLALIPPKAVAVLQVNGIERVQDRLDKLLKAAVPDRADEASRVVRDGITDALAGRDLKALRPDGRVLVGIADIENLPNDATLTFLFPAKSADDFRTRFLTPEERKSLKKDGDLETVQWEDRKDPFYLVNLKGYVAVCSDKATAKAYAQGETGAVAKQLSPDTVRTFLDADIGLFINVREVATRYGDRLKTVKSLADLFLRGDTVQGVSKGQLDQLKGAIDAAFQVVEDGTAAVVGIEFRPDGLAVRGLAQMGEKTATNEALKKYTLTPLPQLGALPGGQANYSASALNVPGSKTAALMAGGFGVEDADPTAGPAIEGLQKELAGYDRGIALTAGSMFGAGLEAIESKDAAKFVAGRLGLLKAVTKGGSFNKVPLKEKPEIKEGAETVGGFTLHRARLRYDIDRAVADLPEEGREAARTSLKRSLGGDESSIWIGTDGKVVLQLTGKDWSEAKALAAAYIDNTQELAKSEAYQFTRKQLPADATLLIILDAAQTAHSVFGMLRDTGTAPKKVPEPKAVGAKTAYVGIALVLKPGHGRFELFVPAAAVDSIRKLVEPLLDNDK